MMLRSPRNSTSSIIKTHSASAARSVPSVRKLSRLGNPMEALESRVMMSAATLATPTALAASAAGSSSVDLTWSEATRNATGYTVLRSTNGGELAAVSHITGGTITAFVDTNVLPNKSYTYRVQAIAPGKVTPASVATTVKTPLATPTSVTATLANGRVVISWTGADNGATGYYVLRSTNGAAFSQIASVTSRTITTITDSAITSGQSYRYEVQAYSASNTSAISSPITLTTPLAAPSGLSAITSTSSLVHVAWTDNDPSATGYQVLRSTDGTHFATLSKIGSGSSVSMDDKTVLPFTTYYYEIQATTAAVTSAASNIASAKTLLAVPTALTLVSATPTTVSLKWTDSDAAAMGYYVLRSDGGSFTQVGQVISGKTTTFTDTASHSNKTYSYEVESYNGSAQSAATTALMLTTPLATPTGLLATTISGTSIQLTWTDNDPTATGYLVLRSTDGKVFVNSSSLLSGTANSFTDTVASGHMYCYSLIATAGQNTSGMASLSTAVAPLVAPAGLTATATSSTNVQLNWTDRDPAATGYLVSRSMDGSAFTLLTTLTSATANTITDKTAVANHAYSYKVQAINGLFAKSATTDAASVTTPMLAPTNVTAKVVGSWINILWTGSDPTATGYAIMRSTDGISYTQLAIMNSGSATSYADTTAAVGQKYYYQVQATDGSLISVGSSVVSATVTAPSTTTTVAVTTRYGNELVITATGGDDTISVTESGSTLSITADGQTTTDPAPAAGIFLYTRGGADAINIDRSVTTRTTVETIDNGVDDITSAGANVSAWVDSTDIYIGNGTVHAISTFAGAVAKSTGAALANPKDAGHTQKITTSLWGTGPVAGDINQGGVGDCYFLSSLAAFAGTNPAVVQESAVDMGDGTYTVQFYSQNKPVFVRVSNDISTGAYWGYAFNHPGTSGDAWAMVMEKAYADFRTGANTYASLNSGWMGDVYAALGQASNGFGLSGYSESALYTMLSTDLASGKAVTFGTSNAPNLVNGHAYTLVSCSIDANGVTSYVVRNPWGFAGDSMENGQGYATLTFAQMKANFIDGCQAI